MSDSKPTAPIVQDQETIHDTNTDWSAQHSDNIMSNNDQDIGGVMPSNLNFDFNAMSATQEHGALPDYSMFEGGFAYDHTGASNTIGDDMAQSNHFSGDFQEALDAKTPGYPIFDTQTGDYFSSDVYDPSSAQVSHDFQPSHAAQTPFGAPSHDTQTPFGDHTNTYEAKTPFVAAIPFTSPHMATTEHSGEMADLNLDASGSGAQPSGDFSTGAQPSDDFFTGAQPSHDFFSGAQPSDNNLSGPQTSDDVSHAQPSGAQPSNNLFFPNPSPMDTTFPFSGPSSPAAQPISTMKAPTSRKAKTEALTAIAGDEDSEEETRSLLTSRGKGKAKVQTATADDEQDVHDHDDETPAVGSSNKGKGRKGAATKTPTDTPSKRSRAAAAKKATKATAAGLNTMGHQRVRQAAKNGIAQTKPIPHSFEDCDEADQTLINMRENGATWNECKARYAELDGVVHGASTIPNRYERLKTAFIVMRDEDNLRLFTAKKELEDDFNQKKWALIAAEIVKDGGNDYDPEDLRRRFKQLMDKAGFPVDEGLAKDDADFKVDGADEVDEDMDIDDEDDSLAY